MLLLFFIDAYTSLPHFLQSVLTERSITMPCESNHSTLSLLGACFYYILITAVRDGTVDWTTLGNILRSKLLGEVR